MKNIFLLTCLFLITVPSFSQDDRPWRIGMDAAYDKVLSPSRIVLDEYMGYNVKEVNSYNSFGLAAEFRTDNGLAIQTGFRYAERDFTATYDCSVCDYFQPPLPVDYSFEILEIPLILKYYYSLPYNFNVFADAGFINEVAVKNELFSKDFYFRGTLGGGFEYNTGGKLAFQARIGYSKTLTRMIDDSDFRMSFLSASLGLLAKI